MKPLDELWERVQPLLPPAPQRRFRFPDRKPLDYRMILTGILISCRLINPSIDWRNIEKMR